jgi:hypothetical protein
MQVLEVTMNFKGIVALEFHLTIPDVIGENKTARSSSSIRKIILSAAYMHTHFLDQLTDGRKYVKANRQIREVEIKPAEYEGIAQLLRYENRRLQGAAYWSPEV